MDAFQTCEILMNHVKRSNLNFSLNESPFSVSLSIRKTFVKDRNGVERNSGVSLQDNYIVDEKQTLENENKSLKLLLIQHEHEKDALKDTINNFGQKLEKARSELTVIENELDEKKCELADIKAENKKLKNEMESLDKAESEIELQKNKQHFFPSPTKFSGNFLNLTSTDSTNSFPILNTTPISSSPESLPSTFHSFHPANMPASAMNMNNPPPSTNLIQTEPKIEYNVEIKNNFELLAEPKTETFNCKQDVPAIASEDQPPKIDENNYKEYLKYFLENFRENGSETPKYQLVAMHLMNNNHNMFHVHLRDVKQFNRNLGGFMVAQYRNLSSEFAKISQKFIEDLDLGVLKHGLYFSLNRSN